MRKWTTMFTFKRKSGQWCSLLTLCLVGVNLGGMENIGRKIGWKTVFSTVWQKKENGKEGKPGRKFSLSSSQNSSSQIRRKRLERKCSHNTFTKILSPNVYNNSAWHNKKKEAKNNHPTTKPSTTTKHRNLAQKINPKSTEN